MRFKHKKLSSRLIRLISNRFFNIEETLLKVVINIVNFEAGGLGTTKITVKELVDNKLVEREIIDREELLEILFLPLQVFEEKYKDLVDENGVEHTNNSLIEYREKVHKKYERLAGRVVTLSVVGFIVGVFSNILGNLGANVVSAWF